MPSHAGYAPVPAQDAFEYQQAILGQASQQQRQFGAPPTGPPPSQQQQRPYYPPPVGSPPHLQQPFQQPPNQSQYGYGYQQDPWTHHQSQYQYQPRQQPPSYQSTDPFQAPREEGDNVPDDFKYGGSVAEATLPIRMQFIRKVYTILFLQIILTTILSSISILSDHYRHFVQHSPWLALAAVISSMVFMFLTYWKRKSYPANLLFLSGFTLLEAYAISVVVSFYDARIVVEALFLTLGIFFALTLFAFQSKYDFTSWMPYLGFALWFLFLFGFMAMCFPANSTTELVYAGASALIFSAYILVDTQLVIRHHHVEEEIAAAMSLYLDVINLFLALLRILNSQSD